MPEIASSLRPAAQRQLKLLLEQCEKDGATLAWKNRVIQKVNESEWQRDIHEWRDYMQRMRGLCQNTRSNTPFQVPQNAILRRRAGNY